MKPILRLPVVVAALALSVGIAADEMISHVPIKPLAAEELERFHGHLGPFVALGARMGEHAVIQREIPKYFGLKVLVECPATPPHSCLIDGLQMSTGATMGKKNIVHEIADSIRVTITNEKNGDSVTYRIPESTYLMMKDWEEVGLDVEDRGHRIFAMNAEELFEIK
ncbi:MAG: formylmethanofuran dehydrogenase subunit E family protein [Candidatus Omnitrophica bacterium]|nr:formylmethanofuran dehydrogenase subunit E family protein [Candidatus Omnitrophota bacterium]MCA9418105.1 formylmethanofuran dehydrogenase subunit E family protein [Candidatus Omnitrophota bacterium]MCA9431465.1 formylmethanofuran dehydrogenase subunit E family protein [Candidatus Omnitrophota bacterium]MCA9435838.1 formylmethanofuran dehydrogenase subunit E family protein [Candidatus Omnitrophota bacterium]MCB9770284.1 formylmethanofuran dehydrogenase subunit E family protein [Candidatus Om